MKEGRNLYSKSGKGAIFRGRSHVARLWGRATENQGGHSFGSRRRTAPRAVGDTEHQEADARRQRAAMGRSLQIVARSSLGEKRNRGGPPGDSAMPDVGARPRETPAQAPCRAVRAWPWRPSWGQLNPTNDLYVSQERNDPEPCSRHAVAKMEGLERSTRQHGWLQNCGGRSTHGDCVLATPFIHENESYVLIAR